MMLIKNTINHRKYANGFSLIEILIVVSIIAILTASAIPAYRQLVISREIKSTTTSLKHMITLGLSVARNNHRNALIVPLDHDLSEPWNGGWQLVDDSNQNFSYEPEIDSIYDSHALPSNGISITMSSSNQKIIIYDDQSLWPNSSFYICHPNHPRTTRLIVYSSGRLRVQSIQQSCVQ